MNMNTPSFSSTLLDQIYRSFDRKSDELKEPYQNENGISRLISKCAFHEHDFIFRRSTNSTSSDTSLFRSRCGGTRSNASNCFTFDDRQTNRKNKTGDDSIIKSKSTTVHRVYAGLKKVKQPISPGGRLASFISSIFEKKSKKLEDLRFRDSYCNSVRSGVAEVMKSTARFHPASVIAVGDFGTLEHTSFQGFTERGKFGKPPLPPNNAGVGVRVGGKNGEFEEASFLKGKKDFGMCRKVEEDEDDDGYCSDSSSDLFELDHKALFGDCQMKMHTCFDK